MLNARQRAADERIQIAFDKSEACAACETDERQIGDAQSSRFTREKGQHDDRCRLRQLFDRRSGEPRGRSRRVGARIEEDRNLLEQQREQRCADGAVTEHRQEAAEGKRHATRNRAAFQENDQEEDE